ncbi:MAG TPA: hypothetical protein VLL54_10555 [Pyrinomonadaceae bacterium]|nr:hypothetical protein [Pyrinomonadaceae bacterium]
MQEVSSVAGSTAPSRGRWGVSTSNLVRYYAVANRILAFQGADEPVLNLVHSFLSGYYFTPTKFSAEGPPPAHLIDIHRAPDSLPQPETAGFPIEDGYCYPEEEQLTLVVNGSTIVVGPPEQNRTDIWLVEETAGLHPLALNNVILYAVQAALRRAGLYQFHSGCVLADENDSGVLIVGDSGSGKSTLTVSLLNEGWRFVSDDNLLLHDSQNGITAWALRQYFTFDEPTLRACNLLRFADVIGSRLPSDPDKLRFYARRAFPESFTETCVPGVILFPSISTEIKSRLESIKPADALMRLLRQCPWATCDAAAAPAHLALLAKLASQTRSYSLIAGSDVFANPNSITELLKTTNQTS